MTIVKGYRRKIINDDDSNIKQEIKYGDFELKFRIPQEYDRRWSSFVLENGVLKLVYLRDEDESPIKWNQNYLLYIIKINELKIKNFNIIQKSL